uniref:COMM domain-containing protein n=1 Tax=Panagrolaimus sp. JU765 TaxID=591449 RepID=A0AC34QVF4_9BILA
MRFRFYGGLDCPDWVLAQIAGFTDVPGNVFRDWCGKIATHLMSDSNVWTEDDLKTLSNRDDSRFSQGFIAALSFIIEKSAKNECSPNDLANEMLQLGMSTEHARELADVYATFHKDLHDHLVKQFPREPSLSLVDASPQTVANVVIQRLLVKDSNGKQMQFAIAKKQLNILKKELHTALDSFSQFEKSKE